MADESAAEHVDVLIVGAGLSGIGAACHLRRAAPAKSVAILESRETSGGTWDLFRYPGVRSDSDMHTLGYSFRPWTGSEALADGPSVLGYIRDTAAEYGVDRAIRFGHRVTGARWSSERARWTVTAHRSGASGTAGTTTLTCSFLFVCSGYYRYDQGYTPEFAGTGTFTGRVVHPQRWPEDLDCAGSRVVVIGSGATAVTLVPALARRAAHVTMVQRSPSYILSLASRDTVGDVLRRVLPAKAAYAAVRWKNVLAALALYRLSRRLPRVVRALLRRGARRRLPADFDVDTHFAPRYAPWDERLCLVPDGDLFRAIGDGRASVVTDRIETFTPTGLRLVSGAELAADVVVTATGLNLLPLGGMTLTVDGTEVELSRTVAYKGLMLSGVPNFALTIGYTNASWTLKSDLVGEYVCRLLAHMDACGHRFCTPLPPDPGHPLSPLIDLASGYVRRGIDALPRQGATVPWRLRQSYPRDVRLLRRGRLDDGMRFSGAED